MSVHTSRDFERWNHNVHSVCGRFETRPSWHDASFIGEIERIDRIRKAIRILRSDKVDFEFDGEMSADVALNPELQKLYPFMGLSGPANVLVMPAIHSAAISTKLVQALGGATVIGPLLVGLEKPVQIVSLGASVSEIITAATFAAYDAGPAFQGSGLTSAPRPPAAVVEKPSTAVPPTV